MGASIKNNCRTSVNTDGSFIYLTDVLLPFDGNVGDGTKQASSFERNAMLDIHAHSREKVCEFHSRIFLKLREDVPEIR